MGGPVIPGGYFLIARKMIDSEIFKKPPLYLKVWIYLLSRAQHKEFKELKRGQLWTSIPEIQDALTWKVGYRTERPTKKQIFTVLEWLRNPSERVHEGNDERSMIVTTKGTQGMLITICNYSVYQTSENYEGNDERTTTGTTKSLRPERQGNNINKNVFKNDKNAKNDNKKDIAQSEILRENFEALWKSYPNKKGKEAAFKSYKKAVKDGVTDEAILSGIERYKQEIAIKQTEPQFIQYGSTWFNGKRWEDDYITTEAKQSNQTREQDWSVPEQNKVELKMTDEEYRLFEDELPF